MYTQPLQQSCQMHRPAGEHVIGVTPSLNDIHSRLNVCEPALYRRPRSMRELFETLSPSSTTFWALPSRSPAVDTRWADSSSSPAGASLTCGHLTEFWTSTRTAV